MCLLLGKRVYCIICTKTSPKTFPFFSLVVSSPSNACRDFSLVSYCRFSRHPRGVTLSRGKAYLSSCLPQTVLLLIAVIELHAFCKIEHRTSCPSNSGTWFAALCEEVHGTQCIKRRAWAIVSWNRAVRRTSAKPKVVRLLQENLSTRLSFHETIGTLTDSSLTPFL